MCLFARDRRLLNARPDATNMRRCPASLTDACCGAPYGSRARRLLNVVRVTSDDNNRATSSADPDRNRVLCEEAGERDSARRLRRGALSNHIGSRRYYLQRWKRPGASAGSQEASMFAEIGTWLWNGRSGARESRSLLRKC